MQLIELQIIAFGQFKNRDFHFDQGLTVIYGENEQGKSTLLACLKVLFFGFSGRGSEARKNERLRFQPWDGSRIAANLVFSDQGIRYRLERTFGKIKATDTCVLMNDVTGQPVEWPRQQEVGPALFHVTAEEFANTVFIGQLQSTLDNPDHSTLGKLANLSGSLDEGLSHQALDSQLQKAQVKLRADRGSGGLIPELQAQVEAYEQLRQTAVGGEIQQQARLHRLQELQQSIRDLEVKRSRSRIRMDQLKLAEKSEILSRLKFRHQSRAKLAEILSAKREGLVMDGRVISPADIEQMRQALREARALQADLDYRLQILKSHRDEQEREIAVVRSYEDLQGIDPAQLDQLANRLDLVQAELESHKPAKHLSGGRVMLYMSLALLLVGLVAGFAIRPILYLVAGLGIILLVATLLIEKYSQKTRTGPSVHLRLLGEAGQLQSQLAEWLHMANCTTVLDLHIRLHEAENARLALDRRIAAIEIEQEQTQPLAEYAADAFSELHRIIWPDRDRIRSSPDESDRGTDQVWQGRSQDFETIEQQIDSLAQSLVEVQSLERELLQQQTDFQEALGGQDWDAYNRSVEAEIQESMASGWTDQTALKRDSSAVDFFEVDHFEKDIEQQTAQLSELKQNAAALESAILHSPRTPFMVAEYDEMIRQTRMNISEAQDYYDSLVLAREMFRTAFDEMQASFGPLLNDKTAETLRQLTGSRYREIKIDRSFAVRVEAPEDGRFHEWDYFSGGTVDQIYLALRLAISDLIQSSEHRLPLLLDDIFVQYDDERAKAGLKFLQDKVATEHSQALLLTSHGRIREMAGSISPAIAVRDL